MKLCFSLPNFFEFFKINEVLGKISRNNPEYFKADLCFDSVHGSYPYCYWNGDSNSNKGPGALYHDFVNCGLSSFSPLRLNMSNVNLIEEDFLNVMANIILRENMSGSSYVELSNLKLLEYIDEKYPYYKYVFSKNAHFAHPFTAEIINGIVESGKFTLIELPLELNKDIEFLKSLNSRKSIEIQVNSKCPIGCSQYKNCSLANQKKQYDFSGHNIYASCNKCENNISINESISIEEILNTYAPLGISHYKIDSFENDKEYIDFVVNYFFKDEYRGNVLEILSKEGVL